MKKIINGKRYDTEKAECIGRYIYGYSSDFNHIDEALYVTPRSKTYFLAGEGGANTKYSQQVSQNSWSGGSRIQPMSEEDAFEWAQEYLEPEEIERYFSHLIQDI